MSIPKVKGIETEWCIVLKSKYGYGLPRVTDFIRMINAAKRHLCLPNNSEDIENIERLGSPESLRGSLGGSTLRGLLPNGARLYIDGSHLEYSTAECSSAKALVAADRAGEIIINLARKAANEELAPEGEELIIHKDNSDRSGTSYGCHENYLVSREIFEKITHPNALEAGYLASFLVCRLMFTGSGKMGIEFGGRRLKADDAVYQISQRADFIKRLLSLDTLLNRAIINTRDEPHADEERFARLHLIVGEANLAEVANYMKVGITSIILKMLEDGFIHRDAIIEDPVRAIRLVSRDLTCKNPVLETLGGRKFSSLDLNEEFFQMARAYFSTVQEPSDEEKDLLKKWEETISDFRVGNEARLKRRFDWKIKQEILSLFLEDHNTRWEDIGKAIIKGEKVTTLLCSKDISYHDLDEEKGLYWLHKKACRIDEAVAQDEAMNFVKNPPPECRSYFRGRCIAKFFEEIEALDWETVSFKGPVPLNINMKNPIWGSQAQAGEILDKADNCEELCRELQKEVEHGGKR